jgi:dTDP-4-dehydrorhamnose reductase
MKILLFGSSGMLGNYMKKYLLQFYDVLCIDRNIFDIETCDWERLENIIQSGNLVINCAGAIPQQKCDLRKYIILNTLFPHKINEISKRHGIKFIHISTDCVFSGKEGNYDENSKHDAEDIYGISKSLGEDKTMCVIRTSIIGEEMYNKNNLIEWLIKQKNSKIDGFENVFWNGVTCLQLAKIVKDNIDDNVYWEGTRHIFSPNPVSKYELCKYINEIYGLNINLIKKRVIYKNMILSSIYNMNHDNKPTISWKLNTHDDKFKKRNCIIPDIKEQIKEQFLFNL